MITNKLHYIFEVNIAWVPIAWLRIGGCIYLGSEPCLRAETAKVSDDYYSLSPRLHIQKHRLGFTTEI